MSLACSLFSNRENRKCCLMFFRISPKSDRPIPMSCGRFRIRCVVEEEATKTQTRVLTGVRAMLFSGRVAGRGFENDEARRMRLRCG